MIGCKESKNEVKNVIIFSRYLYLWYLYEKNCVWLKGYRKIWIEDKYVNVIFY